MKRVVFNQKGGVGKSTITCNLAAIAAAAYGRRVLLIDLDAQGNSTQYLLGSFEGEIPTIADFFGQTLGGISLGRGKDLKDYVTPTPYEGLNVIAASPELGDLQSKLEARHKIFKLRDAIAKLAHNYDEIWFDTPPAFNFYSLSALIAADSVLIPFDCDDFSRQGLYTLIENVAETREDHNDDLYVEGIVINQFISRAKLPQRLIGELKAEDLPVIDAYVSSSIKVKESHDLSKPLIHYLPKHKVTEEFVALYEALNQ